MQIDFTKSPYNLSQEDIDWVNGTMSKMSLKEKVGQLFFLQSTVNTNKLQTEIIETISPGGFLFGVGSKEEVKESHTHVSSKSKYPLFLGASVENGASGIIKSGSVFGSNMLISATNNEKNAYEIGENLGMEVGVVGANILLEPVVDIDLNWRCSVTSVHSFGANHQNVLGMAKNYIDGVNASGIECMPRHFPGYGVDERNQLLVTTVNDFEMEEWTKSYGAIYKDLISQGIKTLLVSNIVMPKVVKHLKEDATKEETETPASLSPIIINKLLIEKLQYKGLIVSDSTLMTSFNSLGKREQLLPRLIQSGCDMLLFVKDYLEDYISILKGYKEGIITEERLNEAVYKILATKASMNLHKKNVIPKNIFFDKGRSEVAISKIADEGITLLKDDKNILPITTEKYKNILVIYLDKRDVFVTKTKRLKEFFNEKLASNNFNIVERDYSLLNDNVKYMNENVKSFKNSVDLVIYVANVNPSNLKSNARINYNSVLGLDSPWFVHEVPTILISLGSPYHMYDMPMISTFINCYYATEQVINQVVKKIMGEGEFKGVSPVKAKFDFYGKQEK